MPEQALGGIPLDFGIVMEDKPSELSCIIVNYNQVWIWEVRMVSLVSELALVSLLGH